MTKIRTGGASTAALNATIAERREVTRALSKAHVANPTKHMPNLVSVLSATTTSLILSPSTTTSVDATLTVPASGKSTLKVTASAAVSTLHVSRAYAGGFALGPAQAVGSWVYLPDVSKVTLVNLVIWNDSGTTNARRWRRSFAAASLKTGWNFIRHPATKPDSGYARTDFMATWGTAYRVMVEVQGAWGIGDWWGLGDLYGEVQAKAKLVLINDGAFRSFFEDCYPDMKSRGIPLNAAATFSEDYWGQLVGTIHERLPYEEWKTYLRENGNSTTFHSAKLPGLDTTTATRTGQQLREMNEIAQAELRKLEATGRMWRAAWTQNSAPNAPATFDQLVACAMWGATTYKNGAWDTVLWPPVDPYDLRRVSPENDLGIGAVPAKIDYWFDELETVHGTLFMFVHNIDDTYQYSTPQAGWDHLMTKIDAGVAAGWLECVTFEDLFYGSEGNFEVLPDGRARSDWQDFTPIVID